MVDYISGSVMKSKTHCPASIVDGDQQQGLNYERQVAADLPVPIRMQKIFRQHCVTQLALKTTQGGLMSSTDDIMVVAKIIASNEDQETTHIIEYKNQFDGRPAWKLCRGKDMYEYAMETGAFVEPKLVWSREDQDA